MKSGSGISLPVYGRAADHFLSQALAEAQRRAAVAGVTDQVRDLVSFTEFTFPKYKADPFHHLLGSTLDQVLRGEITRLMVFAPPQHGKSELVSVRFPAWWLGHRPNDPVILSSYAASLAETHSRQARDLCESSEFHLLFPTVRVRGDSRAVDHWRLAPPYRGGLKAVGVGGGLTGQPGMLGLIDDPHADWKEAQSPSQREDVWQWYRSVFRPRIWERGVIVIVMTRWHEDDLAGRILQDQADKWTVLRLPALAETQHDRDENSQLLGLRPGASDPLLREPGEALAPSRFSKPALVEIRTDVGPMVWAAEYQGVPRAAEGNRFKRGWFPIVDSAAAVARRVRYWDKAGTQDDGCYTVGLLMAWGEDGRFYIEDVVRGQWESHEREQIIKQTAALDATRVGTRGGVLTIIEQEPGSSGEDSAKATIRNLAGYSVIADRPTGDKDVRLDPFARQAGAGNVSLLRGGWNGPYIAEMTAIPNGKYRDQGDATSGAFNALTGEDQQKVPAPSRLVVVARPRPYDPGDGVALRRPLAKRKEKNERK